MSSRDEPPEVAVGHHPDVIDDLVRRGRFAVAVVPGEALFMTSWFPV